MVQQPTTGADVDFQDWKTVGVEAVVDRPAAADRRPAQYTIQFQLFDVLRGERLLG